MNLNAHKPAGGIPSNDQPVGPENRWEMPSSSGRARIDCAFIARSERAADVLVCRIEVNGEFWPRGVVRQTIDTTEDFHVVLPQVLIEFASLKALRERLVEWHVNPSSFSIELGAPYGEGQQLTFAIGQDDGLVYSVGKPACMLTYACGSAMKGRWAFGVDQSCIRMCAESIDVFMQSSNDRDAGNSPAAATAS